ncbi:MAG TPA: hypothetical protein VF006_28760 [Longimicrobium sp.]
MPNDPRIVDVQFYSVVPGQPVQIQATIGNGMVGGTSVSHKGVVRELTTGSVTVGKQGDDLKHTIIHCITTVRDINPQSDTTVVTYHVTGGEQDLDVSYSLDVNVSGGFARYVIDFALV